MAAGFVFTLHIAVIVHFLISLFQKFGTSEIYAICYILGLSESGNAWTRDTSATRLKYRLEKGNFAAFYSILTA